MTSVEAFIYAVALCTLIGVFLKVIADERRNKR